MSESLTLLTRAQVAEMLGVSVQMIHLLIQRGELRCIKIGKRFTRVDSAELDRYLESQTLTERK
jgi:excisionase family DNA binding protein